MTAQEDKYIDAFETGGHTVASIGLRGAAISGGRLYRWSGAPPVASLCGSGQEPDGVTWAQHWNIGNPGGGYLRCPGLPVVVEAGGAFASGANLQSDANGRAIQHASGPVIMRALEASSGAGSLVWAVFSR